MNEEQKTKFGTKRLEAGRRQWEILGFWGSEVIGNLSADLELESASPNTMGVITKWGRTSSTKPCKVVSAQSCHQLQISKLTWWCQNTKLEYSVYDFASRYDDALKQWIAKKSKYVNVGYPVRIRGGWRYQNGWIFGKGPRGGGVNFDPKNYVTDFGPLNRAFFGRFPK